MSENKLLAGQEPIVIDDGPIGPGQFPKLAEDIRTFHIATGCALLGTDGGNRFIREWAGFRYLSACVNGIEHTDDLVGQQWIGLKVAYFDSQGCQTCPVLTIKLFDTILGALIIQSDVPLKRSAAQGDGSTILVEDSLRDGLDLKLIGIEAHGFPFVPDGPAWSVGNTGPNDPNARRCSLNFQHG